MLWIVIGSCTAGAMDCLLRGQLVAAGLMLAATLLLVVALRLRV